MPADTAENTDQLATLDDLAGAGSGTEAIGIFYAEDFGADPTGVADSTVALQACLDAAGAVDGTVHLGAGTNGYKFSSPLDFPSLTRMTSAGGGMGREQVGATLNYTGGSGANAINLVDKYAFEIDHVRFVYSNFAFDNTILDIRNVGLDPRDFHIHHCEFAEGVSGGTPPVYARAFIKMHQAIIGQISECHFNGAVNHIIMGDPTGAGNSYCNAVHIRQCSFHDCFPPEGGQILIGSDGMHACSIKYCTFAGGGAAGYMPIRGTNGSRGDANTNLIYSLEISNNYMGDGGGAGGTEAMIEGLNGVSNRAGILIANNLFNDGYDKCVSVGNDGAWFTAIGNYCAEAPLFGTINPAAVGTYSFTSVGNALGAGLWKTAEYPGSYTNVERDDNSMHGQLVIQSSTNFEDAVAQTDLSECLVMGGNVSSGAGLLTIGARGGVYTRSITGAGRCLVLQAGTSDDDNEVQLVAGATPAMKLRANNTGIAFNGTAPVAKPDITGSRGGNAALADLLTSLASLGLITDSSSA